MDFCAFLAQAWAGPTLAALAGVVLSFVAEYVPAYDQLPAKWKRLCFLGACIVVAVVAWLLAPLPGCARPEWPALIMAILAAFGAGTVAHTRKLP